MIRTKKAPLLQTGNYSGRQLGCQPPTVIGRRVVVCQVKSRPHGNETQASESRLRGAFDLLALPAKQARSLKYNSTRALFLLESLFDAPSRALKMTVFLTTHKKWNHSLTLSPDSSIKSSVYVRFSELVPRVLTYRDNQRRT